jgi:hypothetical protein
MKAQKNQSQRLYLQTRNNRWKWMAGATAATAAGVTAPQAGAITINLVNNYISVGGDFHNHLNADLTGDGHPDLTIANAFNGYYYAGVRLNGVQAFCRFTNTSGVSAIMLLGSRRASYRYTVYGDRFGTASLMGSIPIFFKDLHINGGAPTRGFLQVTVFVSKIDLVSLTYTSNASNPASSRAVPDQGSSLALLAMGATGVLALRRWRDAQTRS